MIAGVGWKPAIALLATAVGLSALLGCGAGSPAEPAVTEPLPPEAWDLTTPESAVRSYLDWVSFSYRMANSEIPTSTMTAEEAVRVDAYIQLNRTQGKGIDQQLASFEIVSASEDASAAVVAARESWTYRYFSLDTLRYLTEELEASYDTTYTLVPGAAGWLVNKVEAVSASEVQ